MSSQYGQQEVPGGVRPARPKTAPPPPPVAAGRAARTVTVEVALKAAIVVSPGDTLVVAAGQGSTDAELRKFADALKERLPGVDPVVVTANSLAVYRPGALSYEPARPYPNAEAWLHSCGHIEYWYTAQGDIQEQGCDACESAPDGSWRRLYIEAVHTDE